MTYLGQAADRVAAILRTCSELGFEARSDPAAVDLVIDIAIALAIEIAGDRAVVRRSPGRYGVCGGGSFQRSTILRLALVPARNSHTLPRASKPMLTLSSTSLGLGSTLSSPAETSSATF